MNDTIIPPISVVVNKSDLSLKKNSNIDGKFYILDGLQRTNCILHCINLIDKKEKSIFNNVEDFRKKKIYLEIWENIDFKNILYKMIVLNTGQKKMDYSHQLDILNNVFYEKLIEDGIEVATRIEQQSEGIRRKETFLLADVTEGLVSLINKYPISGKKNAAEFLFERFNIGYDSEEENESLKNVFDEDTYNYIKWILTDYSKKIDEAYDNDNPLKKYNVFLIGFCASIGFAHNKDKERLKKKLDILSSTDSSDPLKIRMFEEYSKKFKSGIGEKRRKYVFETFRNFFLSHESVTELEWDNTYETYFG